MLLADDTALSVRESLQLLIDKLNQYYLRQRVKVNVSGELLNTTELALAYASTVRCPIGIATHNRELQKGLVVENNKERVAIT